MTAVDWQERYAELAERLPELAWRARPVLCGLGVCVDAYLRLEETLRALADAPAPPAAALRQLLLERARRGIGGEVRVDWPGGPAWLDGQLPRRLGLGGTGAQAAQTLAVLGAPTLLALSDRSAAQLALIDPKVRVAGPEGILPAGAIEGAGSGRSPHYIVEFTAGEPAGEIVPPRSSRVIVRFEDDPLEPDPWFERASVELAPAAGAAILSGFNALPAGALPEVLARVRPLAGSWRAEGLDRVHLELGDFPVPVHVDEVLAGLAGGFTSLGLSRSELLKLVPGGGSIVRRAQSLAERFAVERIAVHADGFALALTRKDAEVELEALMAGSLLAATRAWHGRIAVPDGCPQGAVFSPPPQPAIGRHGSWQLACCATPYLAKPAATIGLGDTFLAGTLLVLSQPDGHPAILLSRAKETTA
jgi:ADP-specific Phosphofructokinase/Glucokinase conserved region